MHGVLVALAPAQGQLVFLLAFEIGGLHGRANHAAACGIVHVALHSSRASGEKLAHRKWDRSGDRPAQHEGWPDAASVNTQIPVHKFQRWRSRSKRKDPAVSDRVFWKYLKLWKAYAASSCS